MSDVDDPQIRVTVSEKILCMPSKILFDRNLSNEARMVAALWFLLEREPTNEEIDDYLGYGPFSGEFRHELITKSPAMRRYT